MEKSLLEQSIATLKIALSKKKEHSQAQINEMTGQLDRIGFLLQEFTSDAERGGWNDKLGQFNISECPYPPNSLESADWVRGWKMASDHPHVIANVDYYTTQA